MYCSKAEGMLLAAWLCMPVCMCREMEMLVRGVSEEPRTSRTPPVRDRQHLCARVTQCHPRAAPSAPLSLGQGRAHAHLPAGENKADTNSYSPQGPTSAHSAPCPSRLFLPRRDFNIQNCYSSVVQVFCSILGDSLLLGSDTLMVPSVRPAGEISKSLSIFTPAQVHFPTPTCPLCL